MAITSSVRRQWDDKVYEIRIWRSGAYVGNLGRLVRDLTWTVNRNPAVGYNELSFKVDQLAFSNWCQSHGVAVETIIKPRLPDLGKGQPNGDQRLRRSGLPGRVPKH